VTDLCYVTLLLHSLCLSLSFYRITFMFFYYCSMGPVPEIKID